MKKMTIYALMGKIYNNNQDMPKKIKYGDRIYEWKEYDCGYQEKKKINWVKKWGYVAEVDRTYYYLDHCFKDLHDEVEIIEENNKIEKLNLFDLTVDNNEKDEDGKDLKLHYTGVADTFDEVYDKINEIIDVINEMKNGQD